MKKRRFLTVLLALVLFSVSCVAIACKSSISEGPETGVYYCETENGLPLEITLYNGNKFMLSKDGEIKSGTYKLNNTALSFSFNKSEDGTITNATLESDIINLKYNDVSIRFLKAVLRTVQFNSNQGSVVNSISVLNGKTLARPTDPEREGYQFVGWYTNPECTSPFIFNSQIITSDTTLYAFWGDFIPTKSEFVVSFDLNYEGAPANPESVQTLGRKIYSQPEPTRDGHTFRGWWVSMLDDPTMLSYRINVNETVIEESLTAYALWQSNAGTATKPATPVVDVLSDSVTWQAVPFANSYKIDITFKNDISDTNGFTSSYTTGPTVLKQDFQFTQTGLYTISVTAVGLSANDLSDPGVRYYYNNALARVSIFSIVNSSVLIFNEVANASKYLINIDCGNPFHNHSNIDNGTSTSYNFANCQMRPEGITFKVTAVASGYISSVSRTVIHVKDLNAVTGLHVDDDQLLSWNLVPSATDYSVTVKIGDDVQTIENGSKNTFSLKTFPLGTLEITVTAKTIGFNPSDSAPLTYNKQTIASPKNVALNGFTVTWDENPAALSYKVYINDRAFNATTNSLLLSGESLTYAQSLTGDYQISVEAVAAASSLPSTPITVSNSAFDSIFYTRGVLSWKYVLGASKYVITLNGTEYDTVSGRNYSEIIFDQKGENTLTVVPYNTSNASMAVTIATTDVYTFKVEFSASGAEIAVTELFKAFGDPIHDFPNAENTTMIGKDLEGWYTAPGGAAQNAAKYLFDYYVGGDIILYAFWMPRTTTTSLDSGSGIIEDGTTSADIVFDSHFSLPVPTAEGNGFVGWYSEQNGLGVRYTDELGKSIVRWDIFTGDTDDEVTLYAYYADVLRFNKEGNTYSVTKGSEIELVTNVFIPDTYLDLPVTHLVAFNLNTIENITFGKNVVSYERDTFRGNSNLINIFVNSENSSYSDINGILCSKDKTELLRFPIGRVTATIPASITTIAEESFLECNVVEVTVPANVKVIADEAFRSCSKLRRVNLTKGLETISSYAFDECVSLEEIVLPANLRTIESGAFNLCTELTRVTFEGGSTVDLTIAEELFSTCASLSEVRFMSGSRLKNISDGAFARLKQLTTFTVPATITTIGNNAFQNCSNLESIYFEANSLLETIGSNVFQGASRLTEVVFRGSTKIEHLSSSIFDGSTAIETLKLPHGIRTIDPAAFSSLTKLTEITLPASLTLVAPTLLSSLVALESIVTTEGANANFSSLNGVLYNANKTTLVRYPMAKSGSYELPATVNTIVDGAFVGCENISDVTIEKGNISFIVQDHALLTFNKQTIVYYPSANTAVEFRVPSSVVTIVAYAFSGNHFLESIIFPEDSALTTIGDFAFNNCIRLSSMSLPVGVTSIGTSVFYGCVLLNNMIIPDGTIVINANRYAGFSGLVSIFIPSSVTTIETGAFKNCVSLENVTFGAESSLTTIAADAFSGCSNLSVFDFQSLPNITSIGAGAFRNSGLTSVTIPSTISHISNYMFADSTRLTTVHFEGGEIDQTMGTHVFSNCTSIASVSFDSNSKIKNIGSYAFANTANLNFTTFIMPDSAESIDSYAFYNTARASGISNPLFYGLTSFTFSAARNLKTIGNYAFAYSAISSVTIPDSVISIGDYAYYNGFTNGAMVTLTFASTQANPSKLVSIGNYAFYGNFSINLPHNEQFPSALRLPSALETIGNYAFFGLSKLVSGKQYTGIREIHLPKSLLKVGDYAFSQCRNVNKITFESGSALTTIGTNGFSDLINLTSVAIPNTVNSLGIRAFYNCEKLTTLTLPNSITQIPTGAFQNNSINTLTIPANVTSIAGEAFLPYIEAGKQTTGMEWLAFAPNSKLTFINDTAFVTYNYVGPLQLREVPAGLTVTNIISALGTIESFRVQYANASYRTDSSTGVLLSSDAKTIMLYPAGRTGDYVVPQTITAIGDNAFRGSSKLSNISFAEGSQLKTIGNYAFTTGVLASRNSAITSITIPDTVTYIGISAFKNCTLLNTVNISSNSQLEQIGNNAFDNSGITSINIPDSLVKIGDDAFARCKIEIVNINPNRTDFILDESILIEKATNKLIISMSTIDGEYSIPLSITSINDAAFLARDITSVYIHENVVSIGTNAFANCTKLTNVTFAPGSKLQSIANDAFNGCDKLKTINLQNTQLKTIGSSAFVGTAIGSLVLPDTLESIGSHAFNNVTALSNITIGANSNLGIINSYAFVNTRIRAFAFPKKLTNIGDNAFERATLAGTITFPTSLVSIGKEAFQSCTAITAVVFEDKSQMQSISTAAFRACTRLASVNFGMSSLLRTISSGSFESTILTSVTFPAQLSTIGNRAFASCFQLSEFHTESGSVNFLAENGVLFNRARTTLVLYPTYGSKVSTYNVPSHVTTIGESAFSAGFDAPLKNVVLHDSVTTIRSAAFEYYPKDSVLRIPYSVTVIETDAFRFESGAKFYIEGRTIDQVPSTWYPFWETIPSNNIFWNA